MSRLKWTGFVLFWYATALLGLSLFNLASSGFFAPEVIDYFLALPICAFVSFLEHRSHNKRRSPFPPE